MAQNHLLISEQTPRLEMYDARFLTTATLSIALSAVVLPAKAADPLLLTCDPDVQGFGWC